MQTTLDDVVTLFFIATVKLMTLFATLPGLNRISYCIIETNYELLRICPSSRDLHQALQHETQRMD